MPNPINIDDLLKINLGVRGTIKLNGVKVVIQKTNKTLCNKKDASGRPVQARAHVIPFDPQTQPQITQRNKLKQAVIMWQNATIEERLTASYKARSRGITLYQAYIGIAMQSMIAPTGTIWDGGATTWDAGATTWDIAPLTIWDAGATIWDAGATTWH